MKNTSLTATVLIVAAMTMSCSSSDSNEGTGSGGTTGNFGGGAGASQLGGGAGLPAGGSAGLTVGGSAGLTVGGSTVGGATMGGSSNGGSLSGGSANGGTANGGTANGGRSSGGSANGGTGNGGRSSGGSANGGSAQGGGTAGGSADGGSTSGGSSAGGATAGAEGPCDIYAAANTPCVAAYSTIRRLLSTYDGPLLQIRTGSSSENTGSGGQLQDINMAADGSGFVDTAAIDSACQGTICTVATLYDQSGKGNDLHVAPGGLSNGGQYAAMDDFESSATSGQLAVGGHQVYPLYMAAREGYRTTSAGNGMPRGTEPEGIYMLADGTHYGTACCWDFGNVSPDPTQYGIMNTLFFGIAFWGNGAGNGPWMMVDFEGGVWAGGTNPGDPGWGALDGDHPANQNNPSLPVKFALGLLSTTSSDYRLRMADVQTATAGTIAQAYDGGFPVNMNELGGIVLGVGGDNSNNSWGTFYEGAIVAGAPSTATEGAVLENIQAVGYGQ